MIYFTKLKDLTLFAKVRDFLGQKKIIYSFLDPRLEQVAHMSHHMEGTEWAQLHLSIELALDLEAELGFLELEHQSSGQIQGMDLKIELISM